MAQVRALDGNISLFSHSHFGCLLVARRIGLPSARAQHLLQNTASIKVLYYEHESIDQPAIVLWNSVSPERLDPAKDAGRSERGALKRRAIERWESESGEIRNIQMAQPADVSALHSSGKELFIFELDGTLAECNAVLDAELAVLLKTPLEQVKVAIISACDALFSGGNDYSVEVAGLPFIQVNNAEDTKRFIEAFLASGAGIELAAGHEELVR